MVLFGVNGYIGAEIYDSYHLYQTTIPSTKYNVDGSFMISIRDEPLIVEEMVSEETHKTKFVFTAIGLLIILLLLLLGGRDENAD